jgi:hypothetical protein
MISTISWAITITSLALIVFAGIGYIILNGLNKILSDMPDDDEYLEQYDEE